MVGLRDDLKLALDPVAFARAVGLEEPDPWQEDLLRSESKRVLLNITRQGGKSTTAAILALRRVIYHPGSLVLVLAPALRQSQELFAKLSAFYSALGEPMKKYGERRLSLELTNGSRVVTLPGSERTIRGYSGVSLLILDEAARVDDELYLATRPMLATSGGALMLLTTPAGRRGAFYQEWTQGNGWQRFEVPASEVPRISPEFLAEERRSLPSRVFRQEYMCSFEEAEGQVFTHAEIEQAFSEDFEPLLPGVPPAGGHG